MQASLVAAVAKQLHNHARKLRGTLPGSDTVVLSPNSFDSLDDDAVRHVGEFGLDQHRRQLVIGAPIVHWPQVRSGSGSAGSWVAVELAAWCGVAIVVGVAEEESKVADRDAIVRVALDYFEGWFDGDAARMERTLHPDLAKRSPDDAPAPGELEKLTAREMIEATAKGIGKTRDVPDRGLEVEVEHLHREIANVTVRSAVYVEYLHLVRTRDGWKIVNALWQHP
jgi:hypothetical protein